MKDPYFWKTPQRPQRATARKFWQKVIFVPKMVKKTKTAQLFALRLSSEADHRPFSLDRSKLSPPARQPACFGHGAQASHGDKPQQRSD